MKETRFHTEKEALDFMEKEGGTIFYGVWTGKSIGDGL